MLVGNLSAVIADSGWGNGVVHAAFGSWRVQKPAVEPVVQVTVAAEHIRVLSADALNRSDVFLL